MLVLQANGTVVAAASDSRMRSFHHRSNDGGLSWTPDLTGGLTKIAWGGSKVGTPLEGNVHD